MRVLSASSGQDVARAPAHVAAVLDDHVELAAEPDGLAGVVGAEEVAEVLQDHVRVVIRLQDPVHLLGELGVGPPEALLGLAPDLHVGLLGVAHEGGQLLVLLGGEEPDVGAPLAPRLVHLDSDTCDLPIVKHMSQTQ